MIAHQPDRLLPDLLAVPVRHRNILPNSEGMHETRGGSPHPGLKIE
jgi:hypothetical protein